MRGRGRLRPSAHLAQGVDGGGAGLPVAGAQLVGLERIQLDKDVTDRFFGCGTLALQTSSDDPLLLHDVPQVETVQVEISNLIFDDTQGAIDADPRS